MAKVKVTNRADGPVTYIIPDLNIQRNFTVGEWKMIDQEELQSLEYAPGGDYALKHLLIVEDEKVLEDLNIQVEPEYWYKEEHVVELLKNGTLDQLKDALEFAPAGVIELIKTKAVELEIPDTLKRDAISEATGLNINNAINVNHIMNADSDAEEKETKSERRSKPIEVNKEASKRRTAAPKYNVVNKDK